LDFITHRLSLESVRLVVLKYHYKATANALGKRAVRLLLGLGILNRASPLTLLQMRMLARYSYSIVLLLLLPLVVVFPNASVGLHLSDVTTGETIQSGWIADGGELHGRLQQLHVCIWPSEFPVDLLAIL
jgi:hypothetical protein